MKPVLPTPRPIRPIIDPTLEKIDTAATSIVRKQIVTKNLKKLLKMLFAAVTNYHLSNLSFTLKKLFSVFRS